jgi:hypothetical protein
MAKTSRATRAPRGTKILAKAFFAAADEIPEPQRTEVVKAALAVIRDELKSVREKVAPVRPKALAARGARKAAAPKPAEQTALDQSVKTTVPSDI